MAITIKNLFLLLTFSFLCLSCSSNNAVDDPSPNYLDDKPSSLITNEEENGETYYSGGYVVNVEDFGVKNDGTPENEAFEKAWQEACAFDFSVVLLVPKDKSYILKPINFYGPCKSDITVMIEGTLEASKNLADWADWNQSQMRAWIRFRYIRNLVVTGGGILNGNGEIWWQKSCKVNESEPCVAAPTALTFEICELLRVADLKTVNAQQIHVVFANCHDVEVSRLNITAPDSSPNTDGIHVSGSTFVKILDSVVGTGDDCVSIVSGSYDVLVTNMTCGPGHGISIGSLGVNNGEANVSGVQVNNSILTGTTNGVRIKTWQGGYGYAKNITFQNITMNGVYNPIIINQNYCDSTVPCQEQKSAVAISNIVYNNIKGTSTSTVAMTFNCSRSVPCADIELQDIDLNGYNETFIQSLCNNVRPIQVGKVHPSCT